MLKWKRQYFGHLMGRTDSLEKTLMLDKIEGRRRRGNRAWACWMASPTQWTCIWVNSGSWWCTGKPGMLQSMGSQIRTRLRDWAELKHLFMYFLSICISIWRNVYLDFLPIFLIDCEVIFGRSSFTSKVHLVNHQIRLSTRLISLVLSPFPRLSKCFLDNVTFLNLLSGKEDGYRRRPTDLAGVYWADSSESNTLHL